MQIAHKRERAKRLKNASEKYQNAINLCSQLRFGVSSWTKMRQSYENAKKTEIDDDLYEFYGGNFWLNFKFKV